jgi:hypothetical protein
VVKLAILLWGAFNPRLHALDRPEVEPAATRGVEFS